MMSRSFSFPSRFLSLLVLLSGLLHVLPASADPVAPEEAFMFSARVLSADTVEVRYQIRKSYYLYRDRLSFTVEPAAVVIEQVQLPGGIPYQDDFFGQTEIYRDTLVAVLTLAAPTDLAQVTLHAKSQGCWDGGICYPPTTQDATLDLNAAQTGDGLFDLLDSPTSANMSTAPALDSFNAPAPSLENAAPPRGDAGDESGRIASLLRDAGLGAILASFFGFGLLLAFTPCTFPMIPILSGIIVGQGQHVSRGRALLLSIVYVLGMAITYAAAGVAAGLSGTLLSSALQNVWVLGAFALLFVLLALSMFGFYELQLPNALQSRLSSTVNHQRSGQIGGVAMMGVLSALIVGPCVAAPLAGALLYIAQTGNALLGGAALFVMALGMGVPLLAVGVATRSVLPRVGPWMEGVRKAFGVMLLAVAIWLLTPVAPALAIMLAWAALLILSGVFLRALDPLTPQAGNWLRFWKGVGVMLTVAGIAILAGALAGSRDPLQPLQGLRGVAASAAMQPRFETVASLAELEQKVQGAGRPVMLDFYADWCVSCKEMERFTFSRPEVAAKMEQMLLLKADVTRNDDDAKALLRRFSLFGPPGIIFFNSQGNELASPRVIGFMKSEPFGRLLDEVLKSPSQP